MPALVDSRTVISEFLLVAVAQTALGTLNANITATTTSIVLAGGYSTLAAGVRVVKIGSELIPVTQTAGTLTVEGNGRGYFGGTAAAHTAGDTVYIANLNAIIGDAVYDFASPDGWLNPTPAIVFNVVGGNPEHLRGGAGRDTFERPRASLQCFGGQDAQGNYPAMAPNLVYRSLAERLLEVSSAELVTSGAVMSAVRDSDGQPIVSDKAEPPWPMVLTFANFEIRTLT